MTDRTPEEILDALVAGSDWCEENEYSELSDEFGRLYQAFGDAVIDDGETDDE